jgi:predicted membrane chloride channel (bestrophin family)
MNRNLADFLTAVIILILLEMFIYLFLIILIFGIFGVMKNANPYFIQLIGFTLIFLTVRNFKICRREIPK